MQTIPTGAKGSFSLVITPEDLANRFKDAMLPPVLATPVMIMIMENAALNAMKPYLDASESVLGTRVDVRHLAATPDDPRHSLKRTGHIGDTSHVQYVEAAVPFDLLVPSQVFVF